MLLRHIAARALQSAVVVLGVVTLVFVLLHLLPGNQAKAILGPRSSPVQWAMYDQQNGINDPLPIQYVNFLGNLVHGEIAFTPPGFADQASAVEGVSLNQDLGTLARGPLINSLILTGLSLLVVATALVPLTVFEFSRRSRAAGVTLNALAVATYAIPPFVLGTVLIGVFTTTFPVLSLNAPDWNNGDVLADPPALILPVATLSLGSIALFSRYLRASMLSQAQEDYVNAARARGADQRRVLWRHIVPNSLLPVITLAGSRLPLIFSAQLVVEALFAYPGLGLTFWNAATGRDFYTMLGALLIGGVLTVLGSLIADVLYAVADPRIRAAGAR